MILLSDYREEILPMEVKSITYFKKHQALDTLMSISNHGLKNRVVLSESNVFKEGKITYLPLYLTGFFGKSYLE